MVGFMHCGNNNSRATEEGFYGFTIVCLEKSPKSVSLMALDITIRQR